MEEVTVKTFYIKGKSTINNSKIVCLYSKDGKPPPILASYGDLCDRLIDQKQGWYFFEGKVISNFDDQFILAKVYNV